MNTKKIDLVVTRHPGLVTHLNQLGLCGLGVEVIDLATPDDVTGRHVCGVLPHSLSCLTETFTEVPLILPQELRGKELTANEVKRYAGPPVTYTIRKCE